jgi:hypothetical protein
LVLIAGVESGAPRNPGSAPPKSPSRRRSEANMQNSLNEMGFGANHENERNFWIGGHPDTTRYPSLLQRCAIRSAWRFATGLRSLGERLGSLQRWSRVLSSQFRAAKFSGLSAAPEGYRALGVAVTITCLWGSDSRVRSLPSCSLRALSSSLVAPDIGRLMTDSASCVGEHGVSSL